jgi:hypothetical protein
MTPDERKALAEQITTNPLFVEVMADMERRAIERLIYEKEDTASAQLRVQAIRTLKEDLENCLNIRDKRVSPP